jgi:hypothetical protein
MIARAAARHSHACAIEAETSVLMDHLVRELVRLQSQVELLRESIDTLTPTTAALTVVHNEEEPRSVAG